MPKTRRIAFLAHSHPGQPGVAELARQAADGERPRTDYVELARLAGGDVIDAEYMETRATPLARLVARRAGFVLGQICEAFVRKGQYRTVVALSDRLGLPLALLHKLTLSRSDLVLVSAWLSRPKKAVFFRRFGVDSKLRAIISGSSVQLAFAAEELAVPRHKLHLAPWPVDTEFWTPQAIATENVISSVGWEARDYGTLLQAVAGLGVEVELAVGVNKFTPPEGKLGDAGDGDGGPAPDRLSSLEEMKGTFSYELHQEWLRQRNSADHAHVRVREQLRPLELRRVYARSRFVVVPLHDVDSDCGVTTITEAMAMGKAVVVSRTRGQVDVLEDGKQGIYVPPGDPAALRSAIEHLLAHPEEAERMGRAGRALVEERYTLDAYVEHLAALVTGGDEHSPASLPVVEARDHGAEATEATTGPSRYAG